MTDKVRQAVILMDRGHIDRTLERMTLELYEQHLPETSLGLIGIDQRGSWLAADIAERWALVSSDPVEVAPWHVKQSGDPSDARDLVARHEHLVLIDDVIFSGKTMMKALGEILTQVSPQSLKTLALIDRGHRAWPIMANIVGKRIPTKLNEHVEVRFTDAGACNKVELNWGQ
ncbi:MAG: phosphoribosyltransferase family protein [Bacteroidota bacterium]